MKIKCALFFLFISISAFIATGYATGYLVGRDISKNMGDLEWQNCGSPPGRIIKIWLHDDHFYVETEDKNIYTTWEHFDTCNFALMEWMYKDHHYASIDKWPKNQNEFWVLARAEETLFPNEDSPVHIEKNCVYTFQPKANPPGTTNSLTYARCGMNESIMSQYALLENGQILTWHRSAGDLIPTDPVSTFPIFFSIICGSLGLVITTPVIFFKIFFGHRKSAKY